LRPVTLTACIAALGLVPFLFATGPGSEIQKPLAIVVIGGLVTATLLTLIVLPILYERFGLSKASRLSIDGPAAVSADAPSWIGSQLAPVSVRVTRAVRIARYILAQRWRWLQALLRLKSSSSPGDHSSPAE
jgi:predicted RND superfamily exporter protein